MKPETAKRLLDARNACLEIVQYVAGKNREEFLADRGLQLIVQALFSIVGEARNQVRKLDHTLERRVPEIHSIVGMRNRIAHVYDDIDYGLLWLVASTQVEGLASALDELLRDAPDPNEGFAKE
ncbi:MAG: HepT-like ribonuclease domain-containing protein [Thermomicrobiales bacterium]